MHKTPEVFNVLGMWILRKVALSKLCFVNFVGVKSKTIDDDACSQIYATFFMTQQMNANITNCKIENRTIAYLCHRYASKAHIQLKFMSQNYNLIMGFGYQLNLLYNIVLWLKQRQKRGCAIHHFLFC